MELGGIVTSRGKESEPYERLTLAIEKSFQNKTRAAGGEKQDLLDFSG